MLPLGALPGPSWLGWSSLWYALGDTLLFVPPLSFNTSYFYNYWSVSVFFPRLASLRQRQFSFYLPPCPQLSAYLTHKRWWMKICWMNKWMNGIMVIHQVCNCHRWDLITTHRWWKKFVKLDLTLFVGGENSRKYCLGRKEGKGGRGRGFVQKGLRSRNYCNSAVKLTEQV